MKYHFISLFYFTEQTVVLQRSNSLHFGPSWSSFPEVHNSLFLQNTGVKISSVRLRLMEPYIMQGSDTYMTEQNGIY